jgi:hypothetical protein
MLNSPFAAPAVAEARSDWKGIRLAAFCQSRIRANAAFGCPSPAATGTAGLRLFPHTAPPSRTWLYIAFAPGTDPKRIGYGQGIVAQLASKDINIGVRKSAGSNEDLSAVDASATTIATVFIGSAYDTVNGTLADNATYSRIMPFYPGATRFPPKPASNFYRRETSGGDAAFFTSNNCMSVGCTRAEK